MAVTIPEQTNRFIERQDITAEDLRAVHPAYEKYQDEWNFLNAAYEGVRALVAYGAIVKHERESATNYKRRIDEAYGLSYSKSIVDIFSSYLFKKEPTRELPDKLSNDDLWSLFVEDVDLLGSTFEEFWVQQQRNASIQGHVGILVDKAAKQAENRQEEIDNEIYPYYAAYKPTAILDWEWVRDEFNRPYLAFLKVLDDDGYYRIWINRKEEGFIEWQVWKAIEGDISVAEAGSEVKQAQRKKIGESAVKISEGTVEMDEIPFIWLYNIRSTIDRDIGVSDITDVSRIDVSIIRNLSQAEEIINYAAFPMMRKPMQEAGTAQSDSKDQVGPTAILEFDPENPDSKPDWLDSKVAEPIDAILELIAKKISEIYRSSNVGGMQATEVSSVARSGVALKTEFQLLNSKLVGKGNNVAKAIKQSIKYWLAWQDMSELFDEVFVTAAEGYEIEDLAADLENIMTSKTIVTGSPQFIKAIQRLVVRLMLPGADDKILADIDKEIEEGKFEGVNQFMQNRNQPPPTDEEEDELNQAA